MVAITLTPASEIDIPELRALALTTWEPTYKNILSREQLLFMQEEIYNETALAKQMQHGQQFYFIQQEACSVGFLSLTLMNSTEQRYKLNKLYLLPEMQGKGIGKAALDAAAETVQKMGGKVLELNVNKFNPAKFFYERCGFSVIREEDIPIGNYWMNDFVMEKKLA
ncbi:GNAT family N-acetyltransferase [Adhaeribacter sp. BT258]|uniref:GNAT family N-acetyltransferase n=1 Tax=Adhaeribacter terrigena TaxID=2793070 RepID=A0ABS1C3P0_9BACT|nr:GNAT family N-acetyltransferase [Adhaeribacter terrigena]MBK0404022.1 GNAT family N-acetyltransferase [Adhaeribacter terrigena]